MAAGEQCNVVHIAGKREPFRPAPVGFDPITGIYPSMVSLDESHKIPTGLDLHAAKYVLSQFPHHSQADSRVALIDSASDRQVSYGELRRSIESLASGLYHALEVRKGDVVFVLSSNSVLYPVICLAVLSIGAILTTANPVNTESEITKQVRDSKAKLAVSSPEELHKLALTGLPVILTTRSSDENFLSVEELVECCDSEVLPDVHLTQDETAAILYSSGTTGTSKGVVLTHRNLISTITLLNWYVDVTCAQNDVFLCFVPMFHIYGLVFFAIGLFCRGNTTVLMKKYDFTAMANSIKSHKINNIPAVPPVILGLVKTSSEPGSNYDFASLRRVGSGAAPLGKDVVEGFRKKFPWVELRPGYGLTESCGSGTCFVSDEEAKGRTASCGRLMPRFSAKVVEVGSGKALPPMAEGELWLKSPTVMKEYLENEEATAATIEEGWLKTGDLCYFDEDGYLYIVDRTKELIKHNGYQVKHVFSNNLDEQLKDFSVLIQVAPAELEDLLLSHPLILDAAVIPVEDEATGQIPMAYVVKGEGSELSENQVIQFVASQVAPYKKIRMVKFIGSIPRSAAGKILRKDLISQTKHLIITSKL